MAGIIAEYQAEGYYLLNGRRGTQKGELYHCNDGKVVGYLEDDNEGRAIVGTRRIVTGFHVPERDELMLLKIHSDRCHEPVVWHLTCGNSRNDTLSPRYSGNWGFVLCDLHRPFFERVPEMPTKEDLINFDREILDDLFVSEFVERIKENGRQGFTGELYFERNY